MFQYDTSLESPQCDCRSVPLMYNVYHFGTPFIIV